MVINTYPGTSLFVLSFLGHLENCYATIYLEFDLSRWVQCLKNKGGSFVA